jgi:hypothetical protein
MITTQRFDADVAWLEEIVPLVLPEKWQLLQPGQDGALFVSMSRRLSVIVSGMVYPDGKRWYHVSVAHPERLPSYNELCEVKSVFIGDNKKAIQVFPAKSEHVNIHPNCLHLWHCVDEDPLPDFTAGSGSI